MAVAKLLCLYSRYVETLSVTQKEALSFLLSCNQGANIIFAMFARHL